jgi:hypothetical protein
MKNKDIKITSAIFTAPLLLIPCVSQASPKADVYIASGSLWQNGPAQPIYDLSKALKQHKRAKSFRMTWDTEVGGGRGAISIVLYDRTSHTLKYFSKSHGIVSEEPEVVRNNSAESILYTNVRDSSIHKLAEKYKKPNRDADYIITDLVKLGSKSRRLETKSYNRTYK